MRMKNPLAALCLALSLVAGSSAVIAAPAAADPAPAVASASPGVAAKASPKVTVKASRTTVLRGSQWATLRITVKRGTGKVAVYDGKKRVKTLTLRKGKASYTTSKKLARGLHRMKVVHLASKKSATVKIRVRSKASLAATVSRTTFLREGAPATVALTARVDGKAAAGTFRVREGSTVVAQAKAKGGKATVSLPKKLSVGAHVFTVSFAPASTYVVAPKARKVAVTVTTNAAFSGDTELLVGKGVKAGLYVSRGNEDCFWHRTRLNSAGEYIAGNEFGTGTRYIQILPDDVAIQTRFCEDFFAAPTTPPSSVPTSIPGDGVYRVGYDIAPGTYRSSAPADQYTSVYWERRANSLGNLNSIIDNESEPKVLEVTVLPTDAFLEVKRGGRWTKVR